MSDTEFGAGVRLVAAAADGVTTVVRDMHRAISARVPNPVRPVYRGITEFSYACVRGGMRAGGELVSLLPLSFSMNRSHASAVLGGYVGDRLHDQHSPLGYGMAPRVNGTDIAPRRNALRSAYPEPSGELVVFLHGLIESERWWFPRERPGFGTRLAADLGHTPIYLRYNSGRHVSENGELLDALLGELVEQWPVPVTGLSLIGHSMGGLVARSAMRSGSGWLSALRHVVYLGVPHRGSVVEHAANLAAAALAMRPESAPLARPLRLRSAGIKDLRFGYLTEGDWLGRDVDAPFGGWPERVPGPAPSHVREHFVAATVSRNPRGPLGELFGDLLVTPHSAADSADVDTADRIRIGGLNHFGLLSQDAVYERIREWLS